MKKRPKPRPEPKGYRSPAKSESFRMRLTAEERDMLGALAGFYGLTASAFLRQMVRRDYVHFRHAEKVR